MNVDAYFLHLFNATKRQLNVQCMKSDNIQ